MNAAITNTEQTLRRLCALLSRTEEPLEIRVRDCGQRVYWSVKPCAAAAPYLVGRGGGHVRAMRHLMHGFGKSDGLEYELSLLDPEPGPLRAVSAPPAKKDYEPTELAELLEDVLDALGVGEYVVQTEDRGLSSLGAPQFELEIWVRSEEDYQLMTTETVIMERDKEHRINNVSALGVLWRAAAAISGGRVSVTVRRVGAEAAEAEKDEP